ncbi:MAG: DUF819 family protein [Acidobacteriota bacterium]
MNSFFSPEDHWVIWTFLVGIAAMSIYLEHRFKFAKKITGAVIALVGGMLASSSGLLPTESISYDIVWKYIVPLAIPLLLMKMDVRKIFKETGRLMGAFHISALGTIAGSIVAVALMANLIEDLQLIAPAMTGSYIGGGVNFVALVSMFDPPKDLVTATLVADSGVMVIYFIVLIMLPSSLLFRRFFPKTEKTLKITGEDTGGSDDFWKGEPISLLDIGKSLAIAFLIAAISVKISGFFGKAGMPELIRLLLGQQYLVLTTVSILFPVIFTKTSKNISGNTELGTFLIFVFFVAIGLPASLKEVIFGAPFMLIFCTVILFFNFLFTIVLGKLFKYELEELILAGAVTSGGPMNGIAIAISKKWNKLILPSMMVGLWGYIIGNYLGYLMGIILKNILN